MLTLKKGDNIADKYVIEAFIDNGGFADVWEAKNKDGKSVALKILPRLDTEGVKTMEEEWEKQKDLSDPNMVIATEYGLHNGYPYLVMPYCSGGNASKNSGNYDELEIAKLFSQIGGAIAYLHELDMVHQDIKPNNFLLDNGNYYLVDLGLSIKMRNTIKKYTQSKGENNNSITGKTPPCYRAPELYDRTTIGQDPVKATDIWALGATVFELATGEVPLGEFGGLMQLNDKDDKLPDLPENLSSDLNTIVKKCLSKETWNRPKASDLVKWANDYKANGYWLPKQAPITISPKPPLNNLLKRIVGVIMVIGLAWGSWSWLIKINQKKSHSQLVENVSNDEKKPEKKEIKYIEKPVQKEPEKGGVILNKTDQAIIKEDNQKLKEKTYPIEINNPIVRNNPVNTCISIRKIVRTANRLIVSFRLRKCGEDGSYSIYGPEDPHYAFYVKNQNETYSLISMENGTKGESVKWENETSRDFKATFDIGNMPKDVYEIDIKEAKERTPGQSYWDFKGVSLKLK